jgi:hypothetical protein
MQIQTSSVSANNDLTPTTNLLPRQKNWNNTTIANITGLAAGLTFFTIGASHILESAIQAGWLCRSEMTQTCLTVALDNAGISMLCNAALSLTVGVCAGKVTQLALRGLQTSPQIENKISTEQKA